MTITTIANFFQSSNLTNIQTTTVDSANPSTLIRNVVAVGGQIAYDGTAGSPLATKTWQRLITLSSGAATIDLTALPDTEGTIDMTGLKMLEIFAGSDAANLHQLTVAPGVSNGYTSWVGTNGLLLKSATDQNKLGPMSGTTAVDGTHKTIDIAGTGAEKVLISLIFG